MAYYRLLFLEGTQAALAPLHTALTSFTVRLRSERGIDLTRPPFAAHEPDLASPQSYHASQPLGRAMRDAEVALFRFRSARDAEGGTNVGAFSAAVFHRATPQHLERWHATATRDAVDFVRGDARRPRTMYLFPRGQFLVEGVLPVVTVVSG